MKGWLDKYNDGGPIQPNYNDASVSMSKDFVGDGYSNVGRNYSPAWGGQFEDGGQLPQFQPGGKTPIIVNDKNNPRLQAYKDSSILYNNYVKQYSAKGSKKPLTKEETKIARKQIENPKSVWPQATVKSVKGSNKIKKINYTDDGTSQDLIDDMVHPKIKPTGYFLHDSNFWDRNINLIYKKPTQPVIYEKPKPTPQSVIDWIEGNGSSEEYVPQVEQPKYKDAQPFGWTEDPQTGYRHKYRTSTGELEYPFRGGKTHVTPKMNMGGSMPGAVGFTYARVAGSAPSNGPYAKKTMASAQNGTWLDKSINKLYQSEDDISKWLGNPMQKATFAGQQASLNAFGPHNDAIDNYRHPMAGRYTSEAIQDKLGNVPVLSQAAGFVGSNVLGAGHELSSLIGNAPTFGGSDDRPWLDKIKESGEDIYNNMVGAAIGSTPFMSAKQKSKFLLDLSLNNKLPDGYGQGNMYIKKKQNGGEMKYYQDGLDFKPKSISRDGGWLSKYEEGGVIQDDMGQWNHPGEITEIGSNQITMQGVPYPVLGISDTGDTQMMYPNQEYQYDGSSVTEYPMAQNGRNVAYADNTRVGNVPQHVRPSSGRGHQPDTTGENILEIFDPYGISSWDDIYRSAIKTGMSGETAMEVFGAIPMLGKATKMGQFLDIVSKAVPKTGRQARNVKASVAALKATGKYGPTAGRASDAYQAYDQYEQGGQLTKLDQLTNFTNYNTKQPGGWLSKYE